MTKPMEVMMTNMLNVSMNENIDMIITIINSTEFFSLLAWLTTRGTSQNCEYRHHHQYHHISFIVSSSLWLLMKNIRQHVLKPTWQKTKNSYELHFPIEASDLGVTARKRDSKMLHLKSTRIVKLRERNLKKM